MRGLEGEEEVGGGEARTPVPVTLTPVLQVHTSTSSKSSKFSKTTPAEEFSPRCVLFVASVKNKTKFAILNEEGVLGYLVANFAKNLSPNLVTNSANHQIS